MKLRTLLTIIISAVLMVAVVGCSGKSDTKTAENKTTEPAKKTEATEAKTEDFSKHYEITIGLWGTANFGNDTIANYLNDKFNVTLKFEDFSWADYIQKLNVAASSGTLPDMFAHPAWSDPNSRSTFISWARQGIIKEVPKDLSAYPQLSNIMSDYEFLDVDGKSYFIPRIAWQPENAFVSQALWVRKDWMENVGITKMPENLDELYELLRAFTYDDPDQNGKDDTYGFTKGDGGVLTILNAFQIDNINWIEEDGKYIPSMTSKRTIDAIEYMNRLNTEGILDPDYVTITSDQGMDKFVTGKVGVIGNVAEAYHFKNNLIDKMKKINPEWGPEVVDIIPPLSSKYGEPVTNSFDNFWSGTLFKGEIEEGKFERCLAIYDFLLSEEGLELGRFGLEGQHFEKDDDKYKSTLPIDPDTNLPKSLSIVEPTSGIKTLATWDVDGRWLEPSMPEACVELEKKAFSYITKYERKIDPRTRYIISPAVDAMNIGDVYNETFSKGIVESKDVATEFDAFVEDVLKNKGVAEAIDEYNKKISELGIE